MEPTTQEAFLDIPFQPKILNATEVKKDSRKESPKYQLKSKNIKSFVLFSETKKPADTELLDEDDDLLQQMLGLNNKPMNST